MVKFGIVSDIHGEFWNQHSLAKIGGLIKEQTKEADIMLLAGDIGSGPQAVKLANYLWPDKPVCMVAGNHEYYDYIVEDAEFAMTDTASRMSNMHFLNRDVYLNNDFEKSIRIIGTTLWTDYELYGTQQLSMLHAQKNLADFFLIYKNEQKEKITPEDVLQWHIRDKEWIQQELDKPFDGLTVLMTHHAMGMYGEHPAYMGGLNSPCFISNLDSMVTRDDLNLVVWGHTHHSVNTTIGKTKFVSNQVGYIMSQGNKFTETGDFGIVVEF